MKQQIDTLDATPSKRLFMSIIADYDLCRSICELIDNGLDEWVRAGKTKAITIDIELDSEQQTIIVQDNAGGLKQDELRYIVGPGQTGTSPSDETIGIFGVGTKRAVVALAQDIRIKTRHQKEKTYQIEFDDDWIKDDGWSIPVYEVDNIHEGTTCVELHRLRIHITEEEIQKLKDHLQATYAHFINNMDVTIRLNEEALLPKFFDNWAYPPNYSPNRYTSILDCQDGRKVRLEAVAGLSLESSPAAGEYGVYFYCNDRLIARAMKTFDVGYTKGYAGLPHPKVSLARVLIFLHGSADSMPWNSSKSDISTKHEVFVALHDWLVEAVKDYASLSRNWMGDWPEQVFKYKTGSINDIPILDLPKARKSYLPPLPKSRPRYAEVISQKNGKIGKTKPWTKGLYEGIIAADLIGKQSRLEQRNRISLIILDSTLEIAFKEYLVNDSGKYYADSELLTIFKTRHAVHQEMKKYVSLDEDTWKKISHYYNIRCKLIHERVTVGVNDSDVQDYRETVEIVLKALYDLSFTSD